MFSSEMVDRIRSLASTRIETIRRGDDFYEVIFRRRPDDDYTFRAFVYDEEEMLEINAYRPDLGSLWSRPFERAAFSNSEQQWDAFAQVLSVLFESGSRIEVRPGTALISVACFVEGRDSALWEVAHPWFSAGGKKFASVQDLAWRNGPIPTEEQSTVR